jgi:hypothetical protein
MVPDYLYDSLLEYTNLLIEIVNKLPNVDEIKQTREYKTKYNRFLDALEKKYYKKHEEEIK